MKQGIKDKKYFFACIGYLAMIVTCMLGRILFSEVSFGDLPEEVTDAIWAVISQVIGMAGIPLLLIAFGERPKAGELFKDLGFRNNLKWWVYLVSVALGVFMLGAAMGFSYLTQIVIIAMGGRFVDTSVSMTNSVGMMFLALFTSAVLPGVCEEVLHRGILRRGLKPYFGDFALILLTALLFSLMHTNIIQTVYTFVGGLLMSTLVVKSRSLWPGIIMHFTNNALGVYSDYASEFGWFGGNFFSSSLDFLISNLPLGVMAWTFCCGAAVALTIVIVKFGIKEPDPDIIQPSEDANPIYSGDFDPMTGRRITYEYRFDPMTGKPIVRRKPYRPLKTLGKDKLWLLVAIVAGVVYTLMTLLWRLL